MMQGDAGSFTHWVELYKEDSVNRHMHSLITAAGERNVYDCVSLCNRCAQCYGKCPTALVSRDEKFSPRGRTQLVRMAMEERIKLGRDGDSLLESFESCLQCWGCVSVCSSGTPVPELVLEALRALKKRPETVLGGVLLNSLGNNRKKLELPLKAFNLFRKTGVYSLLSALGVFRLAGHSWLGRFNQAGFPARLRFMDELVEDSPVVVKSEDLPAACYYFSACSTNYFYPGTGLSTLELLNAFVGPVRPLGNGCCGQAAYSRGLLSDARAAARAVISRMETLDSQLPVITECPSCAAFLKNLEQLFLEDPQWRGKAAALAVNVKHISEVISPDKFRAKLRVKKQVVAPASKPVKYPRPFEEMRVTFNDACVASHRLGLLSAPRKLLEHYFGARYTEMPESEICCGGADGYALFQPRLARELGRRKAANAAKVQADVIVVSSPVCVAQMSASLKKYYPGAVAVHYSDFLRDLLVHTHHGTKEA